MSRSLALLALALGACSPPADDGTPADGDTDGFVVPEGAVDERRDFGEPPWEGALVFESAPMVIPPATDVMYCLYVTYDGPTVGMHAQRSLQSKFGHHFIVAGTSASQRDVPDGTVVACTSADALGMDSFEPLFIAGTPESGDDVVFGLPDGMGARLQTGQRIVLQSHYLNTTSTPIVVQDELQFDVIPEDEVETWAAPWVHTSSSFELPVGTSTVEVECSWEEDTTILFLGGHMHEWGAAFDVTFENAPDGPTSLYAIPAWDPVYRDVPPVNDYTGQPFAVKTGDTFRTTCTWNNDTGAPMGFPEEMCVTFGMRYPAVTPTICDRPAN